MEVGKEYAGEEWVDLVSVGIWVKSQSGTRGKVDFGNMSPVYQTRACCEIHSAFVPLVSTRREGVSP